MRREEGKKEAGEGKRRPAGSRFQGKRSGKTNGKDRVKNGKNNAPFFSFSFVGVFTTLGLYTETKGHDRSDLLCRSVRTPCCTEEVC